LKSLYAKTLTIHNRSRGGGRGDNLKYQSMENTLEILSNPKYQMFFGLLISLPIIGLFIWSGRRGKKHWKEVYKCDDPNVPDVRKSWCRACKGHHGTKSYGWGNRTTYHCTSCGSSDVSTPSPITIWTRLLYFSPAPILMLLILIGQIYMANSFEGKISKIDVWVLSIKNPFYISQAIFLVFGFIFYKFFKNKLIFRNDWLNWAKDRGYDEHSENK